MDDLIKELKDKVENGELEAVIVGYAGNNSINIEVGSGVKAVTPAHYVVMLANIFQSILLETTEVPDPMARLQETVAMAMNFMRRALEEKFNSLLNEFTVVGKL